MSIFENIEIPEGVKNLAARAKNPYFAFAISFLLGALFFLPLDRLQGVFLDKARKSGVRVSMGPIGISRGVFPEGGLLGIEASAFRYDLAPDKSLECDQAKISPQIWRLFTLRLQLAVVCKKRGAGSMLITIRSGFPFKMSEPTIFVDLNNVDLASFGEPLGIAGLKGVARGNIEVADLASTNRTGLPGRLDLNLVFNKLQTPSFSDPSLGVSLPSIPLQNAALEMQALNGKIDLKNLSLGSDKNAQIYGSFNGKFQMTPVMGMMFPAGELAGRLRVDKELEETINSGVSLNGLFGTVKASGFREFKKKRISAPQSLLFPPEE